MPTLPLVARVAMKEEATPEQVQAVLDTIVYALTYDVIHNQFDGVPDFVVYDGLGKEVMKSSELRDKEGDEEGEAQSKMLREGKEIDDAVPNWTVIRGEGYIETDDLI